MKQAMKIEIVPECHGDTALIKCLDLSEIIINHQLGNGNLANRMRKNKFLKIIGVTDEDKFKTLPKYFDNFWEEKREDNLILKRHKEFNNQCLTIISKDLENWLLYTDKNFEI